jgi:multidrug efflux pump
MIHDTAVASPSQPPPYDGEAEESGIRSTIASKGASILRSTSSRQLRSCAWMLCLGIIPIAREVFWGPMAFAMIGGIVVATLLTLLFLPALYVAWYRLKEPTT